MMGAMTTPLAWPRPEACPRGIATLCSRQDKEETRQALELANEERTEHIARQTRLLNELNAQHLAARDLADSGRAAFDEKLDEADASLAQTLVRANTWSQRCDNVESLIANATGILARAVGMLTHRSVLERTTQPTRGLLSRMAKQIDEVENALTNLSKADLGAAGSAGGGGSTAESDGGEEADGAATDDAATAAAAAAAPAAEVTTGGGSATAAAAAPASAVTSAAARPSRPSSGATDGAAKGVAASGISMAVASVLGSSEAEGGQSGSVSASELRAAQASLLCNTSETATLSLIEAMGWGEREIAERRPETAPQLDGRIATQLNLRMPTQLPTRELSARSPTKEAGSGEEDQSPSSSPPGARRYPSPPGVRSRSPPGAGARGAVGGAMNAFDAASAALGLDLEQRMRVSVLDPITLAGEAEAEAEALEEAILEAEAGLRVGRRAELEAQAAWDEEGDRDAFKRRELDILVERLGKDEAQRRSGFKPAARLGPASPKPQPPRRPRTSSNEGGGPTIRERRLLGEKLSSDPGGRASADAAPTAPQARPARQERTGSAERRAGIATERARPTSGKRATIEASAGTTKATTTSVRAGGALSARASRREPALQSSAARPRTAPKAAMPMAPTPSGVMRK